MSKDLIAAAVDGDLPLVKKLLDQGASAKRAKSILHKTIFSGWAQGEDVAVLETLLDAGADVNALTDDTPLHEAARVGPFPSRSLAVTNLLLQRGADVDLCDKFGRTALHIAVTTIADQTVRRLIEAGANVNAITKDGTTPMHECIASFNQYLGDEDEEDEEDGAESAAIYVGNVLEQLLNAGAEVDHRYEGETALSAILRHPMCPESIVVLLADAGASLVEPVQATEDDELSPLAVAMIHDYSADLIGRLMAAGNDPKQSFDFLGGASVIAAAAVKRPQAALAMFKADPRLIPWRSKETQATMLHNAAASDSEELVSYLLAQGVERDATNSEGQSALDIALERECENAARVLSEWVG